MTTLTPKEEAILRPEYDKYISGCILNYRTGDSPLSFDDWWRDKADEAKERAKYQDHSTTNRKD